MFIFLLESLHNIGYSKHTHCSFPVKISKFGDLKCFWSTEGLSVPYINNTTHKLRVFFYFLSWEQHFKRMHGWKQSFFFLAHEKFTFGRYVFFLGQWELAWLTILIYTIFEFTLIGFLQNSVVQHFYFLCSFCLRFTPSTLHSVSASRFSQSNRWG